MSIVIDASGISKKYHRTQLLQHNGDGLRHVIDRFFRSPWQFLRRPEHEEAFWALKDVSFEVQQGEVLGLIGRNGAGKSTLLKILSRITRPTVGHATIRGRVGSLLEVGTGFHPELTGRENVFMNGAILGMSKCEIARKFDEIVAFSELEKFIDTPVKHYSSGMFVRLAFAVAAYLEPEIFIVDEVLAVGDINFQKKCLGKMGDVAYTGHTVVLVSHQLNQIRRLCQRVLWIDDGHIRQQGNTHEVVSAYESAMARSEQDTSGQHRGSGTKARFVKWEIIEPRSDDPHVLTTLGPVTVRFIVEVFLPIRRGHHGVALYNHERQLMWGWSTENFELSLGRHEFTYTFPMLPVRPGPYSWLVSLFEMYGGKEEIDAWECAPGMTVATENYQHHWDVWSGALNIPSKFETNALPTRVQLV
jgi:lipopolysaccharide transport system ATP-binding protein